VRAAILLSLALGAVLSGCSVERVLNRVSASETLAVSERARAVHAGAFVADLHADSLLWGRDLASRASYGHVDLPRLRDGGVALQAFTVVTRVPWTINIESNRSDAYDLVTALAVVGRWPGLTRSSRLERALHQARRLEEAAARDGRLRLVRRKSDLVDLVAERERDPAVLGAILGIEGAHALDGEVANVEPLAAAGFRMIGLVHFFDNEFAGSAHGTEKHGLTERGRELVARMEALGIAVDLAHSSSATIEDVLAIAERPLVVSHTGVRGTCDNQRNLSDAHLRGIAAGGGVIGIGFWETAVCGRSARDVARAILHALEVVGDEHVALGSDFDGAVRTPFDATGLAQITQALLDGGLAEASIRRVLGENTQRLFAVTLPDA